MESHKLEVDSEEPVYVSGNDSTRAEAGAQICINRIDVSDRTISVLAIVIAVLSMAMTLVLVNAINDRSEDLKSRIAAQSREIEQFERSLSREITVAEREARLAQNDAKLLRASMIIHKVQILHEDQLHQED